MHRFASFRFVNQVDVVVYEEQQKVAICASLVWPRRRVVLDTYWDIICSLSRRRETRLGSGSRQILQPEDTVRHDWSPGFERCPFNAKRTRWTVRVIRGGRWFRGCRNVQACRILIASVLLLFCRFVSRSCEPSPLDRPYFGIKGIARVAHFDSNAVPILHVTTYSSFFFRFLFLALVFCVFWNPGRCGEGRR